MRLVRSIAAGLLCSLMLMAADPWAAAESALTRYREQLDFLRARATQVRALPAVHFFLFGAGPRTKFLYRAGVLYDARSGAIVHRWQTASELIVPSEYTVLLRTAGGARVRIFEDEQGVWLEEQGSRKALAAGRVLLPRFEEHGLDAVLRVLHHEILVNVIDGKPVPNYFVYSKPWYRDGAMMAMALEKTGNLPLLLPWIESLGELYDRNNRTPSRIEEEADNLGQLLYLRSFLKLPNDPLVARAIAEAARWTRAAGPGPYLEGRSDFALHPVYQTKWWKFGLRALGMPDSFAVPSVPDSYSSLFWWDYRDAHAGHARFSEAAGRDYPYLTWAERHFYREGPGPMGDRDYPLTWESKASQADYPALAALLPEYATAKLAAPHTWHAAEMFLALLDRPS